MVSQPEQIKVVALQFLTDEKINYTVLGQPAFHAKGTAGSRHLTDYWVVPYTYMVFQKEDAFIYVEDAKQQVMYILTNHGYIYPGQKQVVEEEDGEDWDDL